MVKRSPFALVFKDPGKEMRSPEAYIILDGFFSKPFGPKGGDFPSLTPNCINPRELNVSIENLKAGLEYFKKEAPKHFKRNEKGFKEKPSRIKKRKGGSTD